MKFKNLVPGILLLIGLTACIKDTIILDDLSNDILLEFEIPIPLVKANFIFEDLAGDGYDSVIYETSGDTIKLFLVDSLDLEVDTVDLGDMEEDIDFEYVYLHHTITNMFPVGLDLRIYLYDSVISENIDTIWFSNTPGEIFLQAAATDTNELVIEDQVEKNTGVIELDEELFDKLFNQATHLIPDPLVPPTPGFVKILNHYQLQINLGVEAKGSYIIESEEKK